MRRWRCWFRLHAWGTQIHSLDSLGILFLQCERCGVMRRIDR